jgi:hypothetical protein
MQEDYKNYTANTKKKLDKMGISYVWRDSCVDILLELRNCMRIDFLAYFPIIDNFSNCKGIQKLWKQCQYERESKLLDRYFTFYERKTRELLDDNIKKN